MPWRPVHIECPVEKCGLFQSSSFPAIPNESIVDLSPRVCGRFHISKDWNFSRFALSLTCYSKKSCLLPSYSPGDIHVKLRLHEHQDRKRPAMELLEHFWVRATTVRMSNCRASLKIRLYALVTRLYVFWQESTSTSKEYMSFIRNWRPRIRPNLREKKHFLQVIFLYLGFLSSLNFSVVW